MNETILAEDFTDLAVHDVEIRILDGEDSPMERSRKRGTRTRTRTVRVPLVAWVRI